MPHEALVIETKTLQGGVDCAKLETDTGRYVSMLGTDQDFLPLGGNEPEQTSMRQ